MTNDDYEPPEIHAYHVELTEEHVRELRQTGEIICEFDPTVALSDDGPDRIDIHIETTGDSNHRIDEVLE